ncbi:SpoIIE family protein phosphatase [Streptomyces alfalfae]|uniref:SpoIIE family protein phosphatase n=1 Tax=Streptomyces alfalfae TaxID=1642299 RepID=UPI0039F6E4A4
MPEKGHSKGPARAGEASTGSSAGALESIQSGAYVVDKAGRMLAVNAAALRLLGRSAGDMVGQDAHELLHRGAHGQPLAAAQCGMRQAFHGGRTAQGDQEFFARGDGSVLSVSWLLTPYELGGQETGTLVIFHSPDPPQSAGHTAGRPAVPLTEVERLALLAETTTRLTSTLDADEAVRRLTDLVLPRLADWVVIDLIVERDEVWRKAVVRADGSALQHRTDLEGPMPPVPEESPMPLSRALRGVASTLAGPETYRGAPDSGIAVEQRRLFEATGIHSAAIVPLRGARDVLGALTLGRSTTPGDYTDPDIPLFEDIGRRAALALDNARLFQRQRAVAETMQKYLLPQMPQVQGLEMAVRYLPAPDASQVGGDWYDAFTLPDGAIALAIGDVVGHDLEAAAGMAQMRNILRAYAWSQQHPASRVVTHLDEAIQPLTDVTMATLVFARLAQSADNAWQLTWTNAGHPPPLLVTREGLANYLTDGHGLLLGTGLRQHTTRADATAQLPPGSTLILYTDGLIETPGSSLDDGMERLRQHAAALAHRPLTSFTDELLRRAHPTGHDDVALLAVRTPR